MPDLEDGGVLEEAAKLGEDRGLLLSKLRDQARHSFAHKFSLSRWLADASTTNFQQKCVSSLKHQTKCHK